MCTVAPWRSRYCGRVEEVEKEEGGGVNLFFALEGLFYVSLNCHHYKNNCCIRITQFENPTRIITATIASITNYRNERSIEREI